MVPLVLPYLACVFAGRCLLSIADQLKSKVGIGLEPTVYEVEKSAIRRFVEAIGDPNPRWQVAAPPTFILIVGLERIQSLFDSAGTLLHGSTELECFQDVRPGDVITATTTISNVRARESKTRTTSFITIETEYENQEAEVVARSRQLVIAYD